MNDDPFTKIDLVAVANELFGPGWVEEIEDGIPVAKFDEGDNGISRFEMANEPSDLRRALRVLSPIERYAFARILSVGELPVVPPAAYLQTAVDKMKRDDTFLSEFDPERLLRVIEEPPILFAWRTIVYVLRGRVALREIGMTLTLESKTRLADPEE